jgi:Pyridoxamine 5'-phosphate oxidase
MKDPIASRPHWPDALTDPPDATTGLKPWSWALERLETSHNYWIATSTPGRSHLMVIWGIWWENSFWFSTGPRTRKARNMIENPSCVIATEKADQAIIVEDSPSKSSTTRCGCNLQSPMTRNMAENSCRCSNRAAAPCSASRRTSLLDRMSMPKTSCSPPPAGNLSNPEFLRASRVAGVQSPHLSQFAIFRYNGELLAT